MGPVALLRQRDLGPDETQLHLSRTRSFLRKAAKVLEDAGYDDANPQKYRKADVISKVARLAQSNRAQVATIDQWDPGSYWTA